MSKKTKRPPTTAAAGTGTTSTGGPTPSAGRTILDAFLADVRRCTSCYGKSEIFVPELDPLASSRVDILVIGEQPDRELALASGRMGIQHPDSSAVQLAEYLAAAGLALSDVFYTTSVLCIPRDAELRAGRPSAPEVRNCGRHLQRLITMLDPALLIPLGHTSVQSLQWLYPNWTELRQYILNYDIGKMLRRGSFGVYPLLHTSPRTWATRSREAQTRDWKRIPQLLSTLRGRDGES